MIAKVATQLHPWSQRYLSTGGRLTLIYSALPHKVIYPATAYLLPARVIREIDKIRRSNSYCLDITVSQ